MPCMVGSGADMNIVNLTPHKVVVMHESGQEGAVFQASGTVARVVVALQESAPLNGVDTWTQSFESIVNLPEPQDGVLYIVSLALVSAAACGRKTTDLLVPGQQVRDAEGRVVGYRGFIRN